MLSAEKASCAKRVCFSGSPGTSLLQRFQKRGVKTTRRNGVRFRIEFIRIADDARKYIGCIR
jgi:hypothetical protein